MAGYATPTWVNDTSPPINASALIAIGQAIELSQHPYGVCNTAAGTAAKTVTVDFSGSLSLFTGLTVRVKFTNANTAANPTLNVNGTSAKSILHGTGVAAEDAWVAGAVVQFVYDGTYWVIAQSLPINSMIQSKPNPNLLDNWYFVGGGSQQGGMQFPINQRGNTAYTTNGYAFDRWILSSPTGTTGIGIGVASNYVAVAKPNSSYGMLMQKVNTEKTKALLGKNVTFSAMVSGTVYSGTGTVPGTIPGSGNVQVGSDVPIAGGQRIQLYLDNSGMLFFGFVCTSTAGGSLNGIQAAKLELGNMQTLAHEENGAWVLNELPEFQKEMGECQTYFVQLGDAERIRAALVNANQLQFFVPTPAAMRTVTGIIGTPLLETTAGASQTGFTFSATDTYYNGIFVQALKTGHGLTDGVFRGNKAAFSAEI